MTFLDLQNQPPTSITATCMRIKSVASFNGSDLIRFLSDKQSDYRIDKPSCRASSKAGCPLISPIFITPPAYTSPAFFQSRCFNKA